MFAFKKKYFLIIESIKDLELKNIKKNKKLIIIYRRNNKKIENIVELKKFRQNCYIKDFKFFVANNIQLTVLLKADGLYISSYNKSFKCLFLKNLNFTIIGSAHNPREIHFKIKQGCKYILLSKLFKVDYDKNNNFLGVIKFNNFLTISRNLIPLGGINSSNLNSLNNSISEGFALMSEVKKKPAIASRLF